MTPLQRLFAVADDANGGGTKLAIRKWACGACQALEDPARLAEYVAKHMDRCAPVGITSRRQLRTVSWTN